MVNGVLTKKNLIEFFSEKVKSSAQEQGADLSEDVEFYLAQLLTHFSVSKNLFEENDDGELEYRPLALRLYDAVFDTRPGLRFIHLKKLGDTSLYHAGVFYDGLYNQVVDVDYYISMGGNAYHSLANLSTSSEKSLADLFMELSENFAKLVEVLRLSCESDVVRNDHDILKLIDRYQKTGSQKARKLLEEEGILTDILTQGKIEQ